MSRKPTATAASRREAAARVKLRERIKLLRRVARGFDAADGYDLRDLSALTGEQKRRVARYARIAEPMMSGGRKLVRASGAKLKALQEFTGQREKLKDFRVAFVPTVSPETTTVKVDKKNNVKIIRDGIEQRYYFARKGMRSDRDVMREAERLMDQMPAGFYVVLTGENAAILNPVEFRPDSREALRQKVRDLVTYYPTESGDARYRRVAYFFRGFRGLARTERGAWSELRKLNRMRAEARDAAIERGAAKRKAVRRESKRVEREKAEAKKAKSRPTKRKAKSKAKSRSKRR